MSWRETMRDPEFFWLDARLAILLLAALIVQSVFLFILLFLVIIALRIARERGLTVASALRRIRSFIAGPKRPGISAHKRRFLVDHYASDPAFGIGFGAKLSPEGTQAKKKNKK